MATNFNLLTGSLLNVLNTSSIVPKPFTDYNGSLFFGPNQQLDLRANFPVKGRVRPGIADIDNKTYGRPFHYSKTYNVFVDFYTLRGAKDSSGVQDYELLNKYMQYVEDAVIANQNIIGPVIIETLADQDAPTLLNDTSMNTFGVTKLIVFKERR